MSSDADTPNASLLLDRFVSASTAQDTHSSLEAILEGLQKGYITAENVFDEEEIPSGLLQVLQTCQYKDMPVEEGSSLAARIYLEILKDKNAPVLTEPSPGRLLETLVDVASDVQALPYPRVLAVQALQKLCQQHPKQAQNQLLQAPNGLHRLGDLLQTGQDEQVRNEALLLAGYLAKWPAIAKVWMFSEVGDVVIQLAMEEGGLTRGNMVVLDSLLLLHNMLRHDAALADLVFQSPTMAPQLARLLDLRGGTQFLNPVDSSSSNNKKKEQDLADDLDDLMQSGKSKQKESKPARIMPRLTAAEEKIIHAVMDILALVLENDSVKHQVWKKQPALCSLVWEMGLISPPPPDQPFPCAVPSPALQQRALELMAVYFDDPVSMERHAGLDRLLYLVCTGGLGKTLDDKMGLSQAALHVIRQTMSPELANQMLMHTLAPPMEDTAEEQEEGAAPKPPPLTAVQKLINTLADNLIVQEPDKLEAGSGERRKLFLAGSLSALSVFMADEASREIMLRLTSGESSLIDSILEALGNSEGQSDDFVSLVLLRFMCHWVYRAPGVVGAVLSSPQSAALSIIFATKQKKVATLTSLLMGLAMEYMGDESKCGGWTRDSIMEMIAKRGVSRITSGLEKFKSLPPKELPWSSCKLEWRIWSKWYDESVLVVRKRVVQELTSADEDLSEGGEENVDAGKTSNASLVSLQKVVAQQSSEVDELRESLRKAQQVVTSQEKQLATFKLRVESTPTQLDDMLSESTSKNAELDQKIASLEEQVSLNEEKHQSELKARDDVISSLETGLQEAKAREDETRDERDSLREDMTALSQAYANLEEEYQRQAGQTSIATSAPTGEQEESSRQQPEGEVSQQTPTGSTEVSALRAENTRLRQDASAAADWMAMAVERMHAMGAENSSLQQEVAALGEQLQHAKATGSESTEEIERMLSEEKERRLSLEAELSAAMQTEQKFKEVQARCQELESELAADSREAIQQLEEMRTLNRELETQVADLRVEFQSKAREAAQQLEELRGRNQALEKEAADLHGDSQSAADRQQEGYPLREELEREIEDLAKQLHSARGELTSLSAERQNVPAVDTDDDESGSEIVTLRALVQSLQSQLAATESEWESNSQRQQEEIYARESKLRDLESRISGGLTTYTLDDVLNRDAEILELQNANEAAQEWMAKAVGHHQTLSEQVAALTEEKMRLKTQVKELVAKQLSDTARTMEAQLQDELEKQNAELDHLRSDLASRDAEILESRSQDVGRSQEELIQRDAELEALRIDVRVKEERLLSLRSLEESVSRLEEQLQQRNEELSGVRAELESRGAETELLRAQASRVEELDEKLSEYNAQFQTLQSDITAKEEEIKKLRDAKSKDNQEHDEEASDKVEGAEVNMANISADLEAAREELADQEEENRKLRLRAEADGKLKQELARCTLDFNTQEEELQSMEAAIQKITLEKQELLCEKEQLEQELREKETTLASARDVVREWEGKLLGCWEFFALSVDTIILTLVVFLSQSKWQSLSRLSKAWKVNWRSNLAMPTTRFHNGRRATLRWRYAVRNWKGSSRL
jgi:chromosome segregation ATPase